MAEFRLDQGSDASDMTIAPGDRLLLELPENATTGYLWDVVRCPAALDADATPPPPAVPAAIGAARMRRFAWLAARTGSGVLELALRRPWDVDARARSWSVKVVVR